LRNVRVYAPLIKKLREACVKKLLSLFACPMGHVIFKDEFIRATLQNNSRDQFEQSHWSQCFSLNLGKAYEAYYKVQGL
jgi:hypothetical protein